jgi:hypothetical protein
MNTQRKYMLERRGVAAGVAALLAGFLARSSAKPALAVDGQSLILGQTNTETNPTVLTGGNTRTAAAFKVDNTGVFGGDGAEFIAGSSDAAGNSDVGGVGVRGTGGFGMLSAGSGGWFTGGQGGVPAPQVPGLSGAGAVGIGNGSVASAAGPGLAGRTGSDVNGGVWGDTTSTNMFSRGVLGTTQSGSGPGVGVQGISGSGYGVFGQTNSGSGIVGQSNTGPGLQGFSNSQAGLTGASQTSFGILASSQTGPAVGGYSASGLGAFFQTQNKNQWAAFVSNSNATGGAAGNGSLGLVVNGDFMVINGTKAAGVQTSRGLTRLYAIESPVSLFEDFGRGELQNGTARIQLDALFAETIDTANFDVFLTAYGDTRGLYVAARDRAGFEVREVQNGHGSAPFAYRVVARRTGADVHQRLAELGNPLPPSTVPERLLRPPENHGSHG